MRIILVCSLLFLAAVTTTSFAPLHEGSTTWLTIKSKRYSFQVPDFMYEMAGLNTAATSQYGYTYKESDDQTLELYVIVLEETHKEIKAYDLGFEFDALSYSKLAVESIESGLDAYQVLTADPKIEIINEMNCVRTEMKGKLGEVEVYYNMAVFHGKKAFYQVLTWTIMDQRNYFGKDMDEIIHSFKEK